MCSRRNDPPEDYDSVYSDNYESVKSDYHYPLPLEDDESVYDTINGSTFSRSLNRKFKPPKIHTIVGHFVSPVNLPSKSVVKEKVLRTRQKLRSLNELRPGDGIGIVRARGLYKHHAIVSQIIGTDRFTVIELTGDSADSLMFSSSVGPKANVSETALNFSKCHRVYKYRYNSRRNDGYHPIDIARTLFLEGLPQEYQFLKFNCEHFVSYCITGFPYSKQTGKFNSEAQTLLDDYVRDRIKRLPNPLVKLPTENAYFMTDGSSQFYVQPKKIDIYSGHKYSTLHTGSMPGAMWFDDHYDEYYSGNDVFEDSHGYLSQTPGDRTSYYELSRSQPVLY